MIDNTKVVDTNWFSYKDFKKISEDIIFMLEQNKVIENAKSCFIILDFKANKVALVMNYYEEIIIKNAHHLELNKNITSKQIEAWLLLNYRNHMNLERLYQIS